MSKLSCLPTLKLNLTTDEQDKLNLFLFSILYSTTLLQSNGIVKNYLGGGGAHRGFRWV